MSKPTILAMFREYFIDVIIIIVILSVFGSVGYAFFSLPETNQLENLKLIEATQVFDIHNKLIGKLFEENRIVITINNVAPNVINAIVANEDVRFYQHYGIDFIGIARAMVVNIRRGEISEGGSTITQQLAKNLFLTQERTIIRKIKEILLALKIERKFSKEEILQAYLNQVYFGEGAYGIEAASQLYFGKHANELSLAESALLAGLPRGPNIYSPYIDLQAALKRRAVVLSGMQNAGFINSEQEKTANAEPIVLAGKRRRAVQASYFLDYIAKELVGRYGANRVYKGGLKIYTTLDLSIQKAAENVLGDYQGAILSIDPRNGYVLAMVGGNDYQKSQINRVVAQIRQPGSAFKPFLYAVAINEGLTAASIIVDEPIDIGGYKPQNYDKKYLGPITINKALRLSVNVAAVKLAQQIGMGKVIDLAKQMGITTLVPEDNNLAAALGGLTQGVNLLELATAYTGFANSGIVSKPITILKVVDETGIILEQSKIQQYRILSSEVAYIVSDMLAGVLKNGTGTAGNIGRPAAGKTGTTDNYVSAWFVGYTPEILTGIYVGNDDHSPVGLSGSQVAGMWGKMMAESTKNMPITDFPVPANVITRVQICTDTGKSAIIGCKESEYSSFIKGTEPHRQLLNIREPWFRLPGLF